MFVLLVNAATEPEGMLPTAKEREAAKGDAKGRVGRRPAPVPGFGGLRRAGGAEMPVLFGLLVRGGELIM